MTLVSIIVPSFNQGRYIRETLDSILSQDHRPLEVLVLDGGSKDETVDVLRSYGDLPELQWWSEKDRGVIDAINKGCARARGEIVAVQSSDDLYTPGAVTAVVDAFRSDPALGLVFGDVEYIDAASRVVGRTHLPPFDVYEYVGKMTYIPQPSAFFRAEAMQAVGPWREDISYAADAEFYLRVALRYRVRQLDRLLGRYRYHDEQRDTMSERILRDWRAAVEPLTRDGDRKLRRYARSGIDLASLRYEPESRWLRRTMAAYHAMLVNPAVLRSEEFRRTRDLFPGRYPIWKTLSRMKRLLGMAPRTR
ncbi:MAG TPA: glycosyltransferase family 2 protein [Thermoanaerobaculia bacterium]